jgi:pimeloyl-ACP methyl ester carboxylesterase
MFQEPAIPFLLRLGTRACGGSGPMSSAISRGLVGMETLLPVSDVELCVDTVGSPTDIPLLLIGTTVATLHAAGVLDRSGPHPASARNGLLSAVFSKLDCTPRWRERLPEITAPTLVVHGAADPFFPVGNAKALAEEIPGATLLVLDGVGAELPSRAHAEVATAVLAHTAQ